MDFTRSGDDYKGDVVHITTDHSGRFAYRPGSDVLIQSAGELRPFLRRDARDVQVGDFMLALGNNLRDKLRRALSGSRRIQETLATYHGYIAQIRPRLPGKTVAEKARGVFTLMQRAESSVPDGEVYNVRRWITADAAECDSDGYRMPGAARDWRRFSLFAAAIGMPDVLAKGSVAKLCAQSCWDMIVIGLAMGRSTVVEFKGSHFEREIVLWGVRWYVAYPVSYRQLEEMMEERGVEVDHSSLNRWVLKYVPLLDKAFRARKRRVGDSWRMDETYVRIRGQWKYLYRAVDKAGNTVDFLLTAKRDRKAASRFLYKAIGPHGAPAKITIDKSTANTAAIENYNSEHDTKIELRQVKDLNNIVEQDHRAIKRKVRPMMGFKSFWSASVTLAGIELMHMIRKGQLKVTGRLRPAQQFYSLAS